MKRATNLSVDEVLLDEAKAYGINLSETLTEALETRLREERARRWKEENREAIEGYCRYIEEHGVFGEDFRTF